MSDLLHYSTNFLSDNHEWMVFIHGAGGSSTTWKYQVRSFKSHFNLLLIDLRDHGQSKNLSPSYQEYDFDIITNDILRTIDHVGIKSGHFLSLSLGSIILQCLHTERPDMIKSMVMAGGVFKGDWRLHIFAHTGKFLSYFVPFRWIYDTFILIVLPRKNHATSRRLYGLQSKKLTSKEFLKWLGLYRDLFKVVRNFYKQPLTTKCLIVMGSQDHVFLDAAEKYAKTHQPLADIVIMEKCGHLCNLENASKFNKIVLDWYHKI